MTGEMTKVISVRIPMTAYMGFIKKATQNKLTVSEFLYTKLFSDEDIERDKNEIIELKAALIESNEKMASVVNERDGLDKALTESNDKIASILSALKGSNDKIEIMGKALRMSDEKMISMENEYNERVFELVEIKNREIVLSQEETSKYAEKADVLARKIDTLTYQQESNQRVWVDKISGLEKRLETVSKEKYALEKACKDDIKKKPRKKIENIGTEIN